MRPSMLRHSRNDMHLRTLQLRHFRNFTEQNFNFNPEFNFIFGRNAQGKTNIIEAIYYIAELKSFRTSNRAELIQTGREFASIDGLFEKDDLNWEISINLTPSERKVLLNQKSPSARGDYYELIPVILFEPRHIYLFRDSPSKRREYLNRAVYIQNPKFLKTLRDYDKVVTQKNKLLKERRDYALVEIYNEQLAKLACDIVAERLTWFQSVAKYLAEEYRSLSHSPENLSLQYLPSFDVGAYDLSTNNQEALYLSFLEQLKAMKYQEADRRESLIGPHRDDYAAKLDERVLGQYGSQGENRSTVIALKLAQLKLFTDRYQKTPLFLLDDVASELDIERCRYLFSYLRDEHTQVFVTTTENHVGLSDYQGHSSCFEIVNGCWQPA